MEAACASASGIRLEQNSSVRECVVRHHDLLACAKSKIHRTILLSGSVCDLHESARQVSSQHGLMQQGLVLGAFSVNRFLTSLCSEDKALHGTNVVQARFLTADRHRV